MYTSQSKFLRDLKTYSSMGSGKQRRIQWCPNTLESDAYNNTFENASGHLTAPPLLRGVTRTHRRLLANLRSEVIVLVVTYAHQINNQRPGDVSKSSEFGAAPSPCPGLTRNRRPQRSPNGCPTGPETRGRFYTSGRRSLHWVRPLAKGSPRGEAQPPARQEAKH